MYVDLHVHSVFSDGCLTPEQLVQEALRAQVSFLALADHNTLSGCERMRTACKKAGIRTIDAVEIDTIFRGEDLHILSYGADHTRPEFAELIQHSRAVLDKMSSDLVEALEKDGRPVSSEEYANYPEQTGRGGWKALYYICEACSLSSAGDVFSLYNAYDITYAKAGFIDSRTVIDCIHKAGGLAVLAHPGDVNRFDSHVGSREMALQMEELFGFGLDGAECHYPKHDPAETELYVQTCQNAGKLITSGSDCHGAFSGKPVGYMKKRKEDLFIEELWRRSLL